MPSSDTDIVIKGAREHNLRDVNLVLPRNQLICLTGVSGSGKSSLAFDTLYAEGQRRYVESLSSYARQFLGQMPKPDVDFIGGLSPSISISQKSAGSNPRSTVGTITEIYDYLRVLYARVGTAHCPGCNEPITAQSREEIIELIMAMPRQTKLIVMAPLIRAQKGEYKDLFDDLRKQGFARARVDGQIVSLSEDLKLDRQMRHTIEVVVDRLAVRPGIRPRLAESVDLALKVGRGNVIVTVDENSAADDGSIKRGVPDRVPRRRNKRDSDRLFSIDNACTTCGISFDAPSPQLFSFNSPQGMCLECAGLGEAYSFDVNLLIPKPELSVKRGCFEPLGGWKGLGRWRRAVFQGIADTVERTHKLPEGTMLETPWNKLKPKLQQVWLWGSGDENITITWRGGSSPIKYGTRFEGIIPRMLSRYRNAKSRILLNKLEKYMRTMRCPDCNGDRVNEFARHIRITTASKDFGSTGQERARSLPEVSRLPIDQAKRFFSELELGRTQAIIATEALKEIRGRLGFLTNVGLNYLALDRTAPTLSGGESQRIRLAGQIGCGLVGVLYILDEPSIGLHPRDNHRLLQTLQQLRDVGNTVVVVEHDQDTMLAADHIIDFGPGPGVRGGDVVAEGPATVVKQAPKSVTGQFLAGKRQIEIPSHRREGSGETLRILGAAHNNLRKIDVAIPLGKLVCVTGVSGSGKSSLISDILVEALRRDLNFGNGQPGDYQKIEGLEYLDKMIAIDQTPIGRTPRSNPGTYIKVFDDIRKLFTQLPESKRRGYKPGRFSFNVNGGRCQACDGNGSNRLEMDFLADVWVTCPVCEGHRFNRETLSVKFKGSSIADVLEMDIQQALKQFENIPKIHHKLKTLHDVGLDYLKLGQPSPTLSGGEAQRVKLARELVKKSTGQTLYLLDEPTTGLHFADIELLLNVLHGFVEAGNTVLIVEHNLDVVKTADWIIDLGPEGGAGGGEVIACGTPEDIAQLATSGNPSVSYTGGALARAMGVTTGRKSNTNGARSKRAATGGQLATHISVRGARQHNLKDVQAKIPRDQMTVFCGPSGSGKSSLAMDTIYAEGQRRYVESLSSYARQFVSQMQKPQLEHIEGLSPAIAIEQQNLGSSPRSTVGTTTEIYDYLRVLMARAGTPFCPDCDKEIGTQTVDEIVDKMMAHREGTRAYIMAPVKVEVGQKYESLWEELRRAGFVRVRVDNVTCSLDEAPTIDRRRKHQVAVLIDRAVIRGASRSRIAESAEAALAIGKGVLHLAIENKKLDERHWEVEIHNQHLACDACGRSFESLTPHNFSFNSQLGWCDECEGLGTQTGANPAALLRDSQATLADGALLLWPNLELPIALKMLKAFSETTGIPLDQPFDQIPARQRRLILHGTGERWFEVVFGKKTKKNPPTFRFQFKGLYPALDESARLTASLRQRLNHLVDEVECSACGGGRLRDDAAATRFRDRTVDDLCRMPLAQLQKTVGRWKLNAREKRIAGELVREITSRVKFLNDVGLEYLTLARAATTLSGGEAQRIRLASQLGSGLCGVLYVLDEPTIGLHPRDNLRLLKALYNLRDLGNTLILVEHDREILAGSDMLFDFGPAAGKHGGEIVASGTVADVKKLQKSVTGPYLSGKKAIPVPSNRRPVDKNGPALFVLGARHHNLHNINVLFPLGHLVAVTGPSGSGKSSLVDDIVYASLASKLHRAKTIPGAHDEILGIEFVNKVIRVDQQPLGNSPTSNPATYTKAFDLIRQLFAQLPESKLRGYTPRRFSFNVPGGRCEACEGNGQVCIEMHFLPDVWVPCETCRGKRYNNETLQVKFHGQSIADVLDMTCDEAEELFANIPKIRRILDTLVSVGLGYLTLGQPAPTLSGGEAQRVKLAAELARPDTGQTLYLLDEPTTGLHFDDLAKLLTVMHRLVDLGNTVVVIEHNLDVIKSADWVIDMGPDAGERGGRIVAEGTPEEVARLSATAKKTKRRKIDQYATGHALAPVIELGPREPREVFDPAAAEAERQGDLDITEVGQNTKMPWEVDGRTWHVKDRVGRRGEPCRWDGRIMDEVETRIQKTGHFAETNWNSRTIVEITSHKKSDGWFLHAITGEAWLLKLKFRVARNTFRRDELPRRIPLRTLNEMEELPIYGNEPRVKCKNLRGPWQEIEFRFHSWAEANTKEFWTFLDQAIAGFEKMTRRTQASIEDAMPWRKLGQKWHFSKKGFPPGKRIQWTTQLLEEVCELLDEKSSDGQFLWNNQQVVHLFVEDQKEPWASLWTKRPQELSLVLTGPKGSATLGRVSSLGHERSLDSSHGRRDILKIHFRDLDDFRNGDLAKFLQEHRASLRA